MATTKASHAPTLTSIVVAARDQVSSDLAGEAVVMSLRTGRYYGVGHVAARIWELLRVPTRVADIRDTIAAEYDVPQDRCEGDVLQFLGQLAAQGLVELRDGTDS